MASAVDSRLAYARLSAVDTASRLPTATRGSNNSYTTSWDTTRGGIKYTSKIKTPQRDYLFCNGRLASMVEGERVTGERFNYWMSALLATQKKIWLSTAVKYEHTWRQIMFQWKTRFNYWMSALLATQKKINRLWLSHSRQVRTYLEADHVPVETAGGHYAVPPSQGSATRHHYLVSGACSRTVKPFVQITYTGFVKNAGTRSLLPCPTTRPPCQAINRLTTRACSSKARGTTSLNGLESVFVARC